jgi:hypothetical protein
MPGSPQQDQRAHALQSLAGSSRQAHIWDGRAARHHAGPAMTTFDEREKSYERKFQHDQELAFKAKARRNKLFGLWVAERLGLAEDAAETYARELVAGDFGKAGDGAIIARAGEDLAKRGVAVDVARLQAELQRWAIEAKKQLIKPD